LVELGPACAICGSTHKPKAHGVWDSKETKRTGAATLARIEFICGMCNFIRYYGMTQRLVIEGRMTDSEMRAVRKHFCTVNKCKVKDSDMHWEASNDEWRQRSGKKWIIDYGPYGAAVQEAQAAGQK
jgi:hypothetical protein